ncbi:MAG: energy-coupling factor transporter transmembrane protein EcfT [Chloroflexi bacterium]|nr:energy-coupling factor transporter transmembrane protein EcfT [Chloroflexota bacterium]
MAGFEGLRYASLGQYIPLDSPVHRADPRTKLLGLGLLVIAVALARAYSVNLLLFVAIIALVKWAHLSLRALLESVRPAWPFILALSAMQLVFYSGPDAAAHVFWAWGPLRISAASLRVVVVSLLRFADLVFLTGLLLNTTTTSALTYGLERLLAPLDALGLPGHELSMVGAIALRFIPILGEAMETIIQAQASRGARVQARSRWQFLQNARRVASLIVPLFVEAYRRAEEMGLAMQARCYRGGRGRTHLVLYRLTKGDYAALGASLLLFGGILFSQYVAHWP